MKVSPASGGSLGWWPPNSSLCLHSQATYSFLPLWTLCLSLLNKDTSDGI